MKRLLLRVALFLALGVVDYFLHRPWRLFVILAVVLYLVQLTAFQHRQETIRIVRQRRHRLANQLQLVTGWLQLGASAKAEEALQGLMQAEAAQSRWFQKMPSHWSHLFLRWDASAEAKGITIEWSGLNILQPTSRMAWMLERRLEQAMRITESTIAVEFRGSRFRIRVPETRLGAPRGWYQTDRGAETAWGKQGSSAASGSSASM